MLNGVTEGISVESGFCAGNLYGRGASDNKAPVLAWIHAVEAYQALGMVGTLRFLLC